MREDPIARKYHHDKMTFGLVYAFTENFVLPLSHDEVVHGKGSLIQRMPGDDWQKFAGLRAYLGSMFFHPGKKLLFMGSELAQRDEWNHDQSLDWHLLEYPSHKGIQNLVRDLNEIYQSTPALHEVDFSESGFEWIEWDNRDNSVFSWLRRDARGDYVICICNFTPVTRRDFRVGVTARTELVECMNTDRQVYGGSNVINENLQVENTPWNGREYSVALSLPPLASIILRAAR